MARCRGERDLAGEITRERRSPAREARERERGKERFGRRGAGGPVRRRSGDGGRVTRRGRPTGGSREGDADFGAVLGVDISVQRLLPVRERVRMDAELREDERGGEERVAKHP
jgi:hypothetical protein